MSDVRLQPDDFDFDGEMKNLANQAQAKSSPTGGGLSRADRNELLLSIGQLIRPLAMELETIRRTNSEQNSMLSALAKLLNSQPATAPALETISGQMQRLNSVESANSKLFDALHAELKGYKDNFLFDTLQKPFIRDLASVFDDLSSMHEQIVHRLAEPHAKTREDDKKFLQTLAGNAENQVHHMIEVFERMDVTLTRSAPGVPVDKKAHRITAFEPTDTEAGDGTVARSLRAGFSWRDRSIRPEEIVARRWQAPVPDASEPLPSPTAYAETVLIPPDAV